MGNIGHLTGHLYATPSVIEGVGRLFDISGTLSEYNYSEDGEEADYLAIKADWLVVGDDMRAAVKQYQERQSDAAA